LAELSEALGADWSEIIPALRLDKRIGPYAYLNPGLGIAGGNLERDLATVRRLAGEYGTDASIVESWLSNSAYRRDWALRMIHTACTGALETVAVWGLAYKPDTTSVRNSPALALIDALKPFSIRAYDPQVKMNGSGGFMQLDSALEACTGADVLAIMTPWAEFFSYSLIQVSQQMRGRAIVDPFGVLDRQKCEDLGFSYFKLGSPSRAAASAA
jgi:UDPglucose 6-dehydrogenase